MIKKKSNGDRGEDGDPSHVLDFLIYCIKSWILHQLTGVVWISLTLLQKDYGRSCVCVCVCVCVFSVCMNDKETRNSTVCTKTKMKRC